MFKDIKLYSILFNKCPKCHVGNFFIDKNSYNLKTFVNMPSHCSHCNESFNKEVGFFYGAMYVSYGLNVTLGIGLFLVAVLLLKLSLITFLILYAVLVITLFPWMMRKSRIIYINLFTSYDKTKSLKN